MTVELSPGERVILEILRDDWRDLFRCTTLDQAMARLDMPVTAEVRCRLATALLAAPDLREGMRWHPSTYILSNDEKVLARVMLHTAGSTEVPTLEDLARLAAVDLNTVREGLTMLTWLGFLTRDRGHLRLAAAYRNFLCGLGLGFHELIVDGRERFNVTCFFDFLLLVHPRYRAAELARPRRYAFQQPGMTASMAAALQATPRERLVSRPLDDRRVTLRTVCAHCAERLTVRAEAGELVDVDPPEARYVRGGGCGVNVLLRSEMHLREWLTEHRFLDRCPRGFVRDLRADIMI